MAKPRINITLGQFIEKLKALDPNLFIYFDFMNLRPNLSAHSYRGYYDELAIGYLEYGENFGTEIRVKDLLACLEEANGHCFGGWKGGEYYMNEETPVWVGNEGQAGDTAIVDVVHQSWRAVIITQFIEY